MSDGRKCGCKGIRTCLLCEQKNDSSVVDQRKNEEVRYVYNYCPGCNLCWPDNEETASLYDFPLYVGKLKLCQDFFTEEEEAIAMTSIDEIPWMPSQSGRRKQDFGPKVNFKKKKVKVGDFKGFPRFTESALRKFQGVPELSDFRPVELCHLEYAPERGSSIDPHVDDFWLWGERLVTINLGSSTVLTLVPCSDSTCECLQELNSDSFLSPALFNGITCRKFSCTHKLQGINSVRSSIETMAVSDATSCKSNNIHPEDIAKLTIGDNNNSLCSSNSSPKLHTNGSVTNSRRDCKQKCDIDSLESANGTNTCDFASINFDKDIRTMCNAFRNGKGDLKVAVRIVLPPRSLFILAGCARYNWFHEIRRQDVVSRRLAMTFRELTAEFLDGGRESELGKDLLTIANTFL